MSRARIVLDGTPFLFTHGGVGRVTSRLVEEMMKLEHEFDFGLVARSFRGENPDTGDCPLTRFRLPRAMEPWMSRLGWIERRVPADLYHATDHAMPLRDPSKAVATIHDLIFYLRPEEHNSDGHAWQRKTVPPFAKNCRHIIACSEHTKTDLVNEFGIDPAKVDVIYWGVDRETFAPPADPEQNQKDLAERFEIEGPFFLGIGCSFGRKNTSRVLEAWRNLRGSHGNHKLVLVWTPPEEAERRFSDIMRMDNVISTGRVSDEELVALYGAADATLYPSLYEGFGLPVLESMSCGTPVITSTTSSLPEVAGDAAVTVDPEDTHSISAALTKFIDDEVDRPELIERGLARCEQFSWEACAQQTLDVYRKALS